MNIENTLKNILSAMIHVDINDFYFDMPLLGEYPELDSMGIMLLLIEIESLINLDTNEITLSAETFATFGSLLQNLEAVSRFAQLSA
ncbi:acyl carrier protein [Paraglaciecola sp.]|uniref:acyl carrier protein n=1 Tax=Paraglaciecola sp. TaxID=1920173 RepID=UPI0030F49C2A